MKIIFSIFLFPFAYQKTDRNKRFRFNNAKEITSINPSDTNYTDMQLLKTQLAIQEL
jgi:hypothetical protein